MTRRKEPSVASFGPHLLNFLRRGSRERVEVTTKNRKPTYYRMRLNWLRQRMKAENHPEYPMLQKVHLSIEGDKLIAQPADSEDLEAFAEAGLVEDHAGEFTEDFYDQFEED